ncbi:MAG: cyclic nucleotide-binding domain-containing protein [Gammaproteobacteria bacterium]
MKSPTQQRIDNTDLKGFLEQSRSRSFRAGATIMAADEEPTTINYLVSGSVEVVIETEEGKELVLAFLNEGHFFGEMGFFNQKTERSAWVRARKDSVVAELSYEQFGEFSQSNPSLVFELATQLSIRLARTNNRVGNLAFLGVSGRVAKVLLELAEEPDAVDLAGGRRLKYTQPQLARIVGCSREMISRVLKLLQSEGLITADDGIIVWGEFEQRAVRETQLAV